VNIKEFTLALAISIRGTPKEKLEVLFNIYP
jgi:hypothetical protein